MKRLLTLLGFIGIISCGCDRLSDNKPDKEKEDIEENVGYHGVPIDFSYVGYHHGEAALPSVPAVMTLQAPEDGADATSLIQNALDKVSAPGAVLLKAGEYKVSGKLAIKRSGVVLRGEGENTVVVAAGKGQRTLITMGISSSRSLKVGSDIVENVPVGQMWVKVKQASLFSPGSRVSVYLKPNNLWVEDLKMNKIQNPNGTTVQWKASDYAMYWEREVTRIEGDKVWLDCPVVAEMDKKYAAKMALYNVSWDRIEEAGIEDMYIVSEYDKSNIEDEDHAWTAIGVSSAENCWVKGIKTVHFGYAAVSLNKGARRVTVKDCMSTAPISQITGSRRYAFYIGGGEMCLFEKCVADEDRHGFITNARVPGPNVFLDCVMTNAHSAVGPHHRWATGILYDCCYTDGSLEVHDRADYGTGHGWSGVNCVLWNCEAKKIACQNPWVNGKNWCVGCIGQKTQGRSYKDGLVRPDGEWISHGVHVEPQSLYRSQLKERTGSL